MTATTHHISNSEVQCWKQCKRKWWLSYYRKLRPVKEKFTGALQLGTNVHEALAAYYAIEPKEPLQVLRDIYDTAIDTAPEEVIGDLTKEKDLAFAMVEGYLEWLQETGVDDGLEIVDSEVALEAPLEGIPVTLIGKLDTRIHRQSDGALFSMDHKTCASFDSVVKLLDINEQPLTYQLLEKLAQPEVEVSGGMLNMLRKVKRTATAKPPFYMRETVHHNDDELRSFYRMLRATLIEMLRAESALDAGTDHLDIVPPTPSDSCSWKCEFRAVCPMFNDPKSYAEGVIESAYKVHNPYQRYNPED